MGKVLVALRASPAFLQSHVSLCTFATAWRSLSWMQSALLNILSVKCLFFVSYSYMHSWKQECRVDSGTADPKPCSDQGKSCGAGALLKVEGKSDVRLEKGSSQRLKFAYAHLRMLVLHILINTELSVCTCSNYLQRKNAFLLAPSGFHMTLAPWTNTVSCWIWSLKKTHSSIRASAMTLVVVNISFKCECLPVCVLLLMMWRQRRRRYQSTGSTTRLEASLRFELGPFWTATSPLLLLLLTVEVLMQLGNVLHSPLYPAWIWSCKWINWSYLIFFSIKECCCLH